MDEKIKKSIFDAVEKEPLARTLGIRLVALDTGYSFVEMKYDPAKMDNIYSMAHGGAVYALIDEAFETAGQTHGTVAVALNVNVTYAASPTKGVILKAVAKEINKTGKTASYDISVTEDNGKLIATCHALAYRTGKPIPFL
ncbi:MAG: PaaI family thioesterase [Desulfobacterales bacterium]|nr:PaaI family thioesterase [Desulfobacterales bacterium]